MAFIGMTRLELMDAQRFDISRHGSCSPETNAKNVAHDPLDTDSILSFDSDSSRSILMDAQRYDYSKRSSQESTYVDTISPKPSLGSGQALDPEVIIERLLLEAQRLKVLDAQRYDPRSRTSSPVSESLSDRHTIESNPITLAMKRGDGNSSESEASYTSSRLLDATNPTETVSDASSIQFAVPSLKDEGQPTRMASSWKAGHMVTTRTVLNPIPRKPDGISMKSNPTTPLFTPPSSRPSSPKSPRAILRALNCLTEDIPDIASAMEGSQNAVAQPTDEKLTIFVTQQVETPLSEENREREQLWRQAMCAVHFGGDWEQMNKRFPPGQAR